MKALHPDWNLVQLSQELGRMWQQMGEEERKPYEKMAAEDKMRYEAEMNDYKAQQPMSSGQAMQQHMAESLFMHLYFC